MGEEPNSAVHLQYEWAMGKKTRDSLFKTMDLVFKMMDFVFKMMILMRPGQQLLSRHWSP